MSNDTNKKELLKFLQYLTDDQYYEKENKRLIDEFFVTNAKAIKKTAYSLTNKINRTDLANELISECYLYMVTNSDKFADYITSPKLNAIVVNWMNKQIIWSKTAFKRKYIDNSANNTDISETLGYIDFAENTETEEEILEQEKAFIDKLNTIYSNLEALPIDKKILFDLIVNQGINTSGKLHKHLNGICSRDKCWSLIKDLKAQLKKGYNENEQ